MWMVPTVLVGASVVGAGMLLAAGFAIGGFRAADVPKLLGVRATGAPGVVRGGACAQVVLKWRYCYLVVCRLVCLP